MNKLIVLWYSKMIHYWNSSSEYFEDLYFSLSQYQSILNIEYGLYIIFPFIILISFLYFFSQFGGKNDPMQEYSSYQIIHSLKKE